MTRKAYYPGKAVSRVLAGEDDLSSWDEEELIRGQKRNKHGQWPNSPPKIVPKALHDELVKRKLTKAYGLLNESIYDAVAILIDIAKDEQAESSVRLKAVKEILDRTLGKAPQHVTFEAGGESKLEEAFRLMLVPTTSTSDDIVDAEIVEADDEEDGD